MYTWNLDIQITHKINILIHGMAAAGVYWRLTGQCLKTTMTSTVFSLFMAQ